MSLIKCSECGKEISDKATACVHCGCPVSKPNPEQKPIDFNEMMGGYFDGATVRTVKKETEQKNTNDFNAMSNNNAKSNWIGMIIALVVGVICLVVESDLNFLLLGMIPLSVKTVGVIFLIIGAIMGITFLVKRKNK